MTRAAIVTVALVLLTLTGVSATDQWPQFRGPQAGVIADDPALPETWSETENVVVEDRISRALVGARLSSGTITSSSRPRSARARRNRQLPGLYDEHDHIKAEAEQRWMVYDVDFKTGKIRWEREMQRRTTGVVAARQEQLRFGNGGHRWRARVRVLWQPRIARRDGLEWQDGLEQGTRGVQYPG